MTVRPPTQRVNRRYVLARVLPGGTIPDQKALYYAVLEAATSLWGDPVASLMEPAVVAAESGHVVVRCRRGMERELMIALSTVTSCGGEQIALRAVLTSGTIETLRGRIREQARERTDPAPSPDCTFDNRACTIAHCDGHKVDVIEKGFKNTTRFYLTTEDMEEH
jgi:ribonuclease P/MRP protein subunit POP5